MNTFYKNGTPICYNVCRATYLRIMELLKDMGILDGKEINFCGSGKDVKLVIGDDNYELREHIVP